MVGWTDAAALATPINRIIPAARGAAWRQGDPGQCLLPAVLLGKTAKPKLSKQDLQKAQMAAWDSFIDAHGKQRRQKPRPKPARRR